jgi:hypothetical protein
MCFIIQNSPSFIILMFLPFFEPSGQLLNPYQAQNLLLDKIENHWLDGLESVFTDKNIELRVPFDCSIFFVPYRGSAVTTIPNTEAVLNLDNARHSAGCGTVVMKFFMGSIPQHLRTAFPPLLLFENVSQASFRTALNQIALADNYADQSAPKSPIQKSLTKTWYYVSGNTPTTQLPARQVLINTFLDVVAGISKGPNYYALSISAGTIIGKPGARPNHNGQYSFWMKGGLRIENMWQEYAVGDVFKNIGNQSKYLGHPFITRFVNVAPQKATFNIKFEVWNQRRPNTYEAIRYANVKIMDLDASNNPVEVTTLQTDNNGAVFYEIPSLIVYRITGNQTKFYFIIERPTASEYLNTGLRLPPFWSTKAAITSASWHSVEGIPGFFKDGLERANIGRANKPATYRVGVSFNVAIGLSPAIEDEFDNLTLPNFAHLLSGLKVYLCMYNPTSSVSNYLFGASPIKDTTTQDTDTEELIYDTYDYHRIAETTILAIGKKTDANCQGIGFGSFKDATIQPQPGWNYFFEVEYEIQNSAINMKKTVLKHYIKHDTWLSSVNDDDGFRIANMLQNSIYGKKESDPLLISIKGQERFAAFIGLNTASEMNSLFTELTENEWHGSPLTIQLNKPNTDGAWYRTGQMLLNMGENLSGWTRAVTAHEFGHHIHDVIMDTKLNIAAWQSATQRPGGASHFSNELSNIYFAFTEGWAEFLDSLFRGKATEEKLDKFDIVVRSTRLAYTSEGLRMKDYIKPDNEILGPDVSGAVITDLNKGYCVEGAFANALRNIFWELIGRNTSKKAVIEYSFGKKNVADTNSWIKSIAARRVFKQYFWHALKTMDDDGNVWAGTIEFAEHMLAVAGVDEKHIVLAEFMRWNIAMPSPFFSLRTTCFTRIASVNQAQREITIKGNHFPKERLATFDNLDFITYDIRINGIACTSVVVTDYETIVCKYPVIPSALTYAVSGSLNARGLEIIIKNPQSIMFTI